MNKLLILFLILISCKANENKENKKVTNEIKIEKDEIELNSKLNTEIIEFFVDSTNIGVIGENKVELIKHRVFNDYFTIVKFYVKRDLTNRWLISNTYQHISTGMLGLDPKIEDFNNDGINDITFISLNAARGSNEVRRLFIFNKREEELISIENSENYPNMRYNKDLDCISAFLVYGGSTSKFLKIKKDRLIEFASVSFEPHEIIVKEKDDFGNWNVIKKDTFTEVQFPYVYFKNYKPLESF